MSLIPNMSFIRCLRGPGVSGSSARGEQETRCCVVTDGKIEYRSIETGLRSGAEIEVVSGLSEKDTVVLARAAGLAQGQPVEVIVPSL